MLGARGVATVAAMALEFEDVEDEGETPGVNGGVVDGRRMGRSRDGGGEGGVWREVWGNWCQLVLVVHDEGASVKHNPLEVEVIKHIVMVRGQEGRGGGVRGGGACVCCWGWSVDDR